MADAQSSSTTQPSFSIDGILQPQSIDQSEDVPQEKKRRIRTSFTQLQLVVLEEAFLRQQYMIKAERIRLADSLGLNQLQVKIWFQNRRIRWRKEQREMMRTIAIHSSNNIQ